MRASLHGISHKSTFQIHGAGVPPLIGASNLTQTSQAPNGSLQGGALDLETRQKLASVQLNRSKKSNIRFY